MKGLLMLLAVACLGGALVAALSPSLAQAAPVTETELRRLVHTHPDSALLHARLASVYFAKGTVEGRSRATRHLQQALKIEPSNNRFRLLLAEVYFEATFWTRGVEQLRSILETEPANGYARFRLGRAYLEKAIEEWQRAWFNRARGELQLVEDGHPAYSRARRKLALCYYDLGMPDSAAVVLEDLPSDSLDTEALLLLGMALDAAGDPLAADRAFADALASMDEAQRDRYVSVDLLATSAELEDIADLNLGDQATERDLFWKRRDPNPATRFNERLIEHLSRVAFADLHFSVPRLDKHGSETSRGEVFIRYGEPLAWFYDPFGTNTFADETIMPLPGWANLSDQVRHEGLYDPGDSYRSRGLQLEKPRWVWRYRDFVLDFEDVFLNGDYTFPYERDWSAYTYAYLEREIPEIYETQIRKKMRVVMEPLNRLNDEGSPRLRIIYACDTRGVDYRPEYEWPEGDFEIQVALLDTLHNDLARSALTVNLSADSSAIYRTTYPLIASHDFAVPPGEALAALSIRSESNGAVGFTSRPVEVRQFGEGLEVSDVELRFTQDGSPNPSHVYLWRGRLYLAFDIYNLTVDRVGTGRAEVAYRITKRQEQIGPARRLSDYLGFTSPSGPSAGIASVESRYELRSAGATRSETIGIDLAPLSRGYYDVELTVKDLLSGEVASVSTEFRIASELEP